MNRQNVFTKLQVCLFIHFNELLKDCKVDVEHKEISAVRQLAKLHNEIAPNHTTITRQIILQNCAKLYNKNAPNYTILRMSCRYSIKNI